MKRWTYSIFLAIMLSQAFSCKQKQEKQKLPVQKNGSLPAETIKSVDTDFAPDGPSVYSSDTVNIKGKKYALSVFRGDSGSCFIVEKENASGVFQSVLKDRNFSTNNSTLRFEDCNHDGFADIIWNKKWQDHAYLFNPAKGSFTEIGEYHDVDTLKVGGYIAYYKKRPILYLFNEEKDNGWMINSHSELFCIDSNYQKISFASIENMSTLDSDNIERLREDSNVIIVCHVPPYKGRYNAISIWNIGEPVDHFTMKAAGFDKTFVAAYWGRNFKKLIRFGRLFKVRVKFKPEYY